MGASITLSEYKEFTGIAIEDTTNDTRIQNVLLAVTRYVERLTCKRFGTADYDEKYQGNNAQELIVLHQPINSIASIEFLGENGGVVYALSDVDYRISNTKNYVFRPEGWLKYGYSEFVGGKISFPLESIRIRYNAGEDIPIDLKWAIIEITADYIAKTASGGRGLKNYKISDVSSTWKDSISSEHMKLIKSYRNGACII